VPTVFREKGHRFFFYMADQYEPPHIHVTKQDDTAKFWLTHSKWPSTIASATTNFMRFSTSSPRIWTNCLRRGISTSEHKTPDMNELRIQRVNFEPEHLVVECNDDRRLEIPLTYFPRLHAATVDQRSNWTMIGRGRGVHWESIDEDLSVENFLAVYSRAKRGHYATTHA